MQINPASDDALLVRVSEHDQAALGLLYEKYSRLVFSIALHILEDAGAAEEVTQEVFLNVWQRAGSYQPDRGKVSTWIASIAHNRAIDHVRRRKRDQTNSAGVDVEGLAIPDYRDGPDTRAERAWERDRVRAAIATLPPEQREVLLLAYFRGLTHVEIAAQLSQPLGTVKTRIRLAVQKLRDQLCLDVGGLP